jgi:hypothetical protein
VVVSKQIATVVIGTDYSLAEIASAAHQTGQIPFHVPLGFYFARVAYRISLHEGRDPTPNCPAIFQASAALALVDRRIEIGRELASTPCQYQRALAHYERHATADENIFTELSARVAATLPSAVGSMRGVDQLEVTLRAVLDQALGRLDEVRTLGQSEVDTPLEREQLQRDDCTAGSSVK